jgi:hypothetical protein
MWFFTQRVGWERFIQTTVATNPRIEQLPAEQRERVLDQQRKFIPIMGWVGPVVFTPVALVAVAGVLLGVFNLALGAQFRFRSLMAVVAYGWLPAALHSLLAIGIMHLKDPEEFDLTRPTAFNAGAFLDPDASAKWLQSLLGSVDLFILWCIVLIAFGVHALDPKRPFGRCLSGVLIPWIAWVLGKAAWAGIFG